MIRFRVACLVLCSAALLCAFTLCAFTGDFAWNRPITEWTEGDVRQILRDSPWAKATSAGILPLRGEDAARDSGVMGTPHGVGYDGLDDALSRAAFPTTLFGKYNSKSPSRQTLHLIVRWESALPIRAAELKAHETSVFDVPEDTYTISVNGIPGTFPGTPDALGATLKRSANLKVEGGRALPPAAVQVVQTDIDLVVLYRFPRAPEIAASASALRFTALIGRLQVAQSFNIGEMQYEGHSAL